MAYIKDTSSKGMEERDVFEHEHSTRVYHAENPEAAVGIAGNGKSPRRALPQALPGQSNTVASHSRMIIGNWNDRKPF